MVLEYFSISCTDCHYSKVVWTHSRMKLSATKHMKPPAPPRMHKECHWLVYRTLQLYDVLRLLLFLQLEYLNRRKCLTWYLFLAWSG